MSQDIHGNYWNVFRNTVAYTDSAACELIDNSIDAGATRVDVSFSGGARGRFVIKDNGAGCDDLESIFRLGGSPKQGGSGRYGVGAKGSMAYFGSAFDVVSVCGGVKRRLTWDTDKDIASGEWKNGMKVHKPQETTEPSGTSITIFRPHTKRVAGASIVGDLSQLLEPAIRGGVSVIYNGEEIEPFKYEWESSCIKEDGAIFGQRYTMWAGIADSSIITDHCGWHVEKNARCLRAYINSRAGLAGNDRILVRVKLHQTDHSKNEWALDPYTKANLSDESLYQELRSRISVFVQPIVGSLDQSKKTVRLEQIRLSIKSGLNELLKKKDGGDASFSSGAGDDSEVSGSGGNHSGGGGGGGGKGRSEQKGTATEGDDYQSCPPSRPRGIDIEYNDLDLAYDYRYSDGNLVALVSRKFAGSGGDAAHSFRVLVALALELYQRTIDEDIFTSIEYHQDQPNRWVSLVANELKGLV